MRFLIECYNRSLSKPKPKWRAEIWSQMCVCAQESCVAVSMEQLVQGKYIHTSTVCAVTDVQIPILPFCFHVIPTYGVLQYPIIELFTYICNIGVIQCVECVCNVLSLFLLCSSEDVVQSMTVCWVIV